MNTVIYNANVYLERERFAQALLIEDGTIKMVGTNEEVLAAAPQDAQKMDAQGKTVIPGFVDTHQHLYHVGQNLLRVDLSGCRSQQDVVDAGRKFIEEHKVPAGEPVEGWGWNQDYFTDGPAMPTRQLLDQVSTVHPVLFTRACGHVMVCNTLALEKAGVWENPPVVEGGQFDLEADGHPNGIVRESSAKEIVNQAILPEENEEKMEEILAAAMEYAASHGLTSVQTNDVAGENYETMLRVYDKLLHEKKSLRVYMQCCLMEKELFQRFLNDGHRTGTGDEWLKIGPLKLFTDGSLGARTALMRQDYADEPGTRGISTLSQEDLDGLVALAEENKMQVAVHAIGDKAAEMILEAYEKNMTDSTNPLRNGVIHCQITTPETLERFKKNNILAQVQPIFIHYDKNIVYDRVGEELAKTSYAFKTLADMGVHVSYGTDSPVEDMNPYNNLYCAVTRMSLTGEGEPYLPEQGVDIYDAVDNYTKESAFVSFDENKKGRLMPGYLADLVILDRNIFEVPSMEIKDVRPVATMIGGEIVYRA